ncbi:MAG: phosphoglucosamine mutase [Ignavibacteriae bacterium]|nr:phosphoglucosamine mutase [Ignavibacteriota bacterium]
MSDIIASVSGVRGILGDNLTPINIIKFTSAFIKYCKKNSKSDKIVVGNDGRLHGRLIADIVLSTVSMSGYRAVDIGVVPTPTVQIATEDLKAAGGIAITASHNPQIWNGLKFLNPDGTFLDGSQIKKVIEFGKSDVFDYAEVNGIKPVVSDYSWIQKHIDKVLKLKSVNVSKIKKRKFKVVVDAVNSSGSYIVPVLLQKLGCKVIELYCDGSGVFPHMPEPLPHNLTQLCNAVKKHKADIGISVDPDSDRLVIITEKGEPFIEENTITTVVRNILKNSKSKNKNVSVNLSTTRAVEDVAKEFGGKVFRSPVGEINVVKEMKKNKSIAGGEGSGGVIIPELHYGRDAMAGIAIVLQEFADYKGKISEYKDNLPQYYISKAKFGVKGNPEKILQKVISHFKRQNCRITASDGVKLDFPEYWVHMRKSNTEPIIRIIVEARNKEEAEKIQKKLTGFLK